jgi:hypothetical protein
MPDKEPLRTEPDVDGYVSTERCIEILFPGKAISLRHFRKLQSQGLVPYLKLGRRTLFKPTEVMHALEKRFKRTRAGLN